MEDLIGRPYLGKIRVENHALKESEWIISHLKDLNGKSFWKILSFRRPERLEWEISLKDQNVRSFLLEDQEDQRVRDHFLWKIRKTNMGDPFGRLEREILSFRRLERPS